MGVSVCGGGLPALGCCMLLVGVCGRVGCAVGFAGCWRAACGALFTGGWGRLAEWCRISEAEALRLSGRPADAIAALDKFAESFPESADLPRAKYLQAVITLEDLKNEDQALKLLQDYLVEYPRSLYLEQARRKARVLANKVS